MQAAKEIHRRNQENYDGLLVIKIKRVKIYLDVKTETDKDKDNHNR
jgi:hypothetical protein